MKAFLVILLVLGALIGGLLTLRRSGRAGMPGEDVLERAKQRAKQQDALDQAERDKER